MKQNDITLKKKDAAFFKALLDKDGETATSKEIRIYTENTEVVKTLNHREVSYRRNKYSKDLLRVETQESNGNKTPSKIITLKSEYKSMIKDLVDNFYSEYDLDKFDSVEQGFSVVLNEIEELKQEVDERDDFEEDRVVELESDLSELEQEVKKALQELKELSVDNRNRIEKLEEQLQDDSTESEIGGDIL